MAKKYKKSEPLNRWVALIFALITIFLGTLFSSTFFSNQPIVREEATEITGVFKEFITHGKSKSDTPEVSLFFIDAPRQYIDSCCVSDELLENLEKIPIGTELKLLINPKSDYVIELIENNEVLLDFDFAQKALERDSVGFLYLGIFLYALAIAFIVQAVLDFKRKIKQSKMKKQNHK